MFLVCIPFHYDYDLGMWDGLLEGRIKLHKTLSLTNRLPQTSVMETFMSAGRDKAITSRDNGKVN